MTLLTIYAGEIRSTFVFKFITVPLSFTAPFYGSESISWALYGEATEVLQRVHNKFSKEW